MEQAGKNWVRASPGATWLHLGEGRDGTVIEDEGARLPRVCQGCGGRNRPDAAECDWCGWLFVSPGRRFRLAGWQVASTVLLIAMLAAVVALGVLNSSRALPPLPSKPTGGNSGLAAAPTPTPAVTPRVVVPLSPTPRPSPTELPGSVPPTAAPTPSPLPRRTALVASTGGLGVTIRREPGPQAPAAGSAREGSRLELTGAEQTVAARLWREIEDPSRGTRGWVAAEFLDLEP